ncbi:MAG: hypothetical protein ACR2PZ_20245 [Pseudomonadales bacterium]
MLRDRHGNLLSTATEEALQAYQQGVDLHLAAQPGASEQFARAIALDADFALAYADLARVLQVQSRGQEAQAMLACALQRLELSTPGERSHIAIVQQLLHGRGTDAYAKIQQHVELFPTDIMVVQPCCGVFGLIGFSGRSGREAENLAFMASLARHYEGDWWFESQYAFALAETGALDRALRHLERSVAENPDNANAAHHQAHIDYESGAAAAGMETLARFRGCYSSSGLLYGHLAWHEALWCLELGQPERMWSIVEAWLVPGKTAAPPINVLTDLAALLLRAEFAGLPRSQALWQRASEYALVHFVNPAFSFADAHAAMAHALVGNQPALAVLRQKPDGPAGDLVAAVARAFEAFAAERWLQAAEQLLPLMSSHERLGGSRAQRDLLELTVAHCLWRAQLGDQARRFLAARRPHLAPRLFGVD